jgi:ABC-2 type transport system ATP-binding protein
VSKTTHALQTKGLVRRYGDLTALGPLDLKIPVGQRISLIGANGSGKTTLMRLVSGLLEPTDGTVEIMGQPVGSLEARAEISYIPDDPVLYDDLSVREHIQYLGPLYGAGNWQEYGDELMQRLGIAHRADDLPSGFSRGLRQKTSLAIGFLRPFSVLMVDEPFVGLDEPGRVALLGLLDDVASSGSTVIVASHQLELVQRADRCIALHDGAITYDGDPKKVDVAKLVGM